MRFIANILKHRTTVVLAKNFNPVSRGRLLTSIACSPKRHSHLSLVSSFRTFCSLPDCLWPNLPPTTEWGYGVCGPDTWPNKYPHAGGKSQSPVDIVSSQVKAVEFDTSLQWKYGPDLTKTIINTGCGWRVDVHGTQSELGGGPLSHAYELVQFHCHWGNTNSIGSEHTVDGKAFAGELHFVHWNKEAFATCAEAVPSPKGLTVIGVLLEVGEENPDVQKLCDVLPNIPVKDDRTDLPSDIDPAGMYPADRSYWTYSGSLTTPPCYESVTWILFKNPITVSEDQLNCFRQMRKTIVSDSNEIEGLVEHNYRPPQSLNEREICECTC